MNKTVVTVPVVNIKQMFSILRHPTAGPSPGAEVSLLQFNPLHVSV